MGEELKARGSHRLRVDAAADNQKVVTAMAGTASAYYGGESVSATSNDGTLAAGSSLTISKTTFFLTSGTHSRFLVGDAEDQSPLGVEQRLDVVESGHVTTVKQAPHNAVGDGVTDDTAAVQAAIDAVSAAGGGRVYFPEGTYLVTGIVLKSNVVLVGDGSRVSTIKLANTRNTNVIASSAAAVKVGLMDLGVDANKANQTAGGGIVLAGVSGFSIVRVRVIDSFNNGILLEESGSSPCTSGVVSNCTVLDSGGHGIATSGGVADSASRPTRVTITANIVGNSGSSQINVSHGHAVTVSANTLYRDTTSSSGFGGVRLSNGASYCAVTGNAIRKTSRGVFIAADPGTGDGPCEYNTVSGNVIEGCHFQGVLAEGGRNAIVGNTVHNCCQGSLDGAIRVSNALYVTVVGNVIVDSAGTAHQYGVRLSGTTDYCTVWANTVQGFTGNAVEALTTNAKVGATATSQTTDRASASSLTLRDHSDYFNVTGTTNIDSVTNGVRAGRVVTLKFAGVLTVNDGTGNLRLNGNFTTSADDTLTLVCDGTNWFEIARSAN